MVCPKCNAQIPDNTSFCPNCGAPMNAAAPAQQQYPQQPQQYPQQQYPQQSQQYPPVAPAEAKPKMPIFKKWWFWALIAVVVVVIAAAAGGNRKNGPEKTSNVPVEQTADPSEPSQTDAPESTAEATETEAEKEKDTYEKNRYYDLVETDTYTDSIGMTHLIHKVLAKQNVSISSSVVAVDGSGNVIGKSSDTIALTQGQYNYFSYSFDADISSAKLQFNANAERDNVLAGERNGVEMSSYNKSGDNLYVTFKQTADELGSFSKFKLLFYNGDKIVHAEDGYFSVYAENLNGKDATDVAEIWVYGVDFDKVEYIYEP